MNPKTCFSSSAILTLLVAGPVAPAQAFVYSAQSLILSFRQTDGSAQDPNLTINLGPIEAYRDSSLAIPLNSLGVSLLDDKFGNLNNLAFSASASETANGQDYPRSTVWNTKARTDVDQQSSPWQRFNTLNSSQGGTAAKISSIGSNAASQGAPQNPDTAATTPDGSAFSYHFFVGTGNFGGSFQGSVENTTGGNFSGSQSVVRSDFYEMTPGSGDGAYYGYFELQGNGNMFFVPAGAVVPEPSTYAAIAATGLVGWALVRNRRQQIKKGN